MTVEIEKHSEEVFILPFVMVFIDKAEKTFNIAIGVFNRSLIIQFKNG